MPGAVCVDLREDRFSRGNHAVLGVVDGAERGDHLTALVE